MIRLIGIIALHLGRKRGQPPIHLELGPLAQVAFGYLLLERRRKVTRDELAEALWGETIPATWQASLRGILFRLRGGLDSLNLDGLQIVASGSGTYQLCLPESVAVDVEVARDLLLTAEEAVERGDLARSRDLAGKAAELSEGEFLPGAAGHWVEHRRAELRESHVRSLEVLSESAAAGGDYRVALGAAESAVRLAPLRESGHLRVMMAHASSGNRAEALQAYHRCRQILAAEMGVTPGAHLQAAYLHLLSDEEWPPPREDDAAKPVARSLPASVDSFVGRTEEVAAAREWLSSSRLVTLTGPPGVGKSRLALEVAGGLAAQYPDGTFLLELTDVRSQEQLARLMSTALTEGSVRGQDPTALLVAAVGDRRILIVLDDCDYLVPGCGSLVGALLRQVPNLRVLATSREPLTVAGEVVLEVPPLSVPDGGRSGTLDDMLGYDAVRLFHDRARSVAPDLIPDPEALAQICHRLDGLPLAIELAAARARALTLAEIARRLDDRFWLLANGNPATSRHHALEAALDWSYERLDEPERILLARLSVFVGGFSLDAVERLWSDRVEDVLEILTKLVKKSFVRVKRHANGNRFHLLETIRDYAGRRLRASGEETALCQRHAAWVTELTQLTAEQLDGPEQAAYLQRLEIEHSNITAALDWFSSSPAETESGLRVALSVWRFWELHGHLAEGRSWLEKFAASSSTAPALRADAFNSAAILAHHQSDIDGARRLYRRSLRIRRQLGDDLGVAAVSNGLAHLNVTEGAYDQARRDFEDNLLLAQALGHESLIAATLMNLGVVEQLLWAKDPGDRPPACMRARVLLEEARRRFEALDNVRGAAQCLENLGSLAILEGTQFHGRSQLLDSLAKRRALGDRLGIAECVRFLGQSALEDDAYRCSRDYLEECAALWQQMGNKRRTAEVFTSLAEVAEAQGDQVDARRYLRESLRLFFEIADQSAAERILGQLEEVRN